MEIFKEKKPRFNRINEVKMALSRRSLSMETYTKKRARKRNERGKIVKKQQCWLSASISVGNKNTYLEEEGAGRCWSIKK